ncbi:MAG: spore coat associated protein CotJA [Firmicutes bacterium]|nr:spore coat associated protein CotJA [Bacillota bacterium]
MKQENSCTWPPLAIATVPIQEWKQTYRPEVSFRNGTIFPELNMPFMGKRNMQEQRGMHCK